MQTVTGLLLLVDVQFLSKSLSLLSLTCILFSILFNYKKNIFKTLFIYNFSSNIQNFHAKINKLYNKKIIVNGENIKFN